MVYYLRLCHRAYFGNREGEQVTSFGTAMGCVKEYFRNAGYVVLVEDMTLAQMRKDGTSFGELIDWLLGSHIHFLITHPHQGLESTHDSTVGIYEQVQRLKYHTGFPSLEKLECPIFRQDKFEYLQHLPDHMIARTHMIPMIEEVEEQGDTFEAQFPSIVSGMFE
jgi:hypothetical protein